MPRFVVLFHDWPEPHWDFLLEAGEELKAWRLLAEPVPGADIPAEPNFDHRLRYLDYEGPISGNRGIVTRWDAGTFTGEVFTDSGGSVELHGTRLRGEVKIQQTPTGWQFRLEQNV